MLRWIFTKFHRIVWNRRQCVSDLMLFKFTPVIAKRLRVSLFLDTLYVVFVKINAQSQRNHRAFTTRSWYSYRRTCTVHLQSTCALCSFCRSSAWQNSYRFLFTKSSDVMSIMSAILHSNNRQHRALSASYVPNDNITATLSCTVYITELEFSNRPECQMLALQKTATCQRC